MKLDNIKYIGVFILILLNLFVWEHVFSLNNNLTVVFFDVGQGDSIFIETPQGHQILIDGGPSGKRLLEKLNREMAFWDKSIDLIILTHPDYDHLNGFNYVLDRYNVENIMWTGIKKDTNTYMKWLDKIDREDANVVITKKGHSIKAGDVNMYVLYPFNNDFGDKVFKNTNESSIVTMMVFKDTKFLFTGDINKKIEDELLPISSFPVSLGTDVIKIAHHGSKYSSSKGFIDIIEPKIAVISCGENNSYGHPAERVLKLLEDFDITILRTDIHGDVRIVSNGSNFKY